MPLIRPLWHCLWFLQLGFHVILSLVVIERRLYRQFPIFASYIYWRALKGLVLLSMNYSSSVTGNEYAAGFAVGAAVDALLGFAMVSEIFKHLLGGYPALRKLGIALFRWVTVGLLIMVIGLAWLAPADGAGHLMSGFYVLQRTVDVLLCGLLLFLFAFSGFVGLSWRSQTFGIALGLGILATVSLATSAIQSQIEPIARNQTVEIMEVIAQGAYLCGVLVWMGYSLIPERGSPPLVKALPEHNLETWNQELERLLHQ